MLARAVIDRWKLSVYNARENGETALGQPGKAVPEGFNRKRRHAREILVSKGFPKWCDDAPAAQALQATLKRPRRPFDSSARLLRFYGFAAIKRGGI